MENSFLHQTQIPPTFLAPTLLAKDIHHIIGSTMTASTMHTKIMNVSTVAGSTIQAKTLQLNTILGSTIQADTLSVSTIVGSTIQANTFIAPELQGSTIQANTTYYNALIGSTLSTTTLQVSSLTGSTIQTNTLGFFDTKVLLNVSGEYITFDLGTGGVYYNIFHQILFNGTNTTNRIHFLGSNDNITWFTLGSPIPENISGTQIQRKFTFTLSNYRYLRLILTEIEIMNQDTQSVLVAYSGILTPTYTYIPINTKTFSPNLSLVGDYGSMYSFTMGGQYSPMINEGYATYIGSLTTTADTGQIIPKKTPILALTTSTIQVNALQVSSFIASTIQTDVLQTSSITGSTIQIDTLTASTIFGSTMRGDIIQMSTLYASNAAGSIIQANQMIFNTLLGSTIQTDTFNASTITTSTTQMNQFSIETLAFLGNTININTININTMSGSTFIGSTVCTDIINVKSTLIGSTIQTDILNGNNIIASTIQTGVLQVSTLSNSTIIGSTIQATQFTGTNIIGSTLQTSTLQVSTIVGSTIQTQQFIVSTILGSTIQMTLLNTSTIIGSTIQTNVLAVGTVIGSTIQVSTIGISTMVGSTIRITSYTASTITGSTIQTNTLRASTIYGSSIIGSTIQIPYITISTISSSTIIGNNLQANKIVITDGNNALSTSVTNASQLQYITNLTSQVSKTGQSNEWNAIQTFSTSSIYFSGLINDNSPIYALGLNASNQLIQFSNISGASQGTLTLNYIPYASGASSRSDSIIYRVNATDLAIGQTTSAFPTSNTFNYIETQIINGEYVTIDLGTGGNYHNQYYQDTAGYTNTNKIHFLGSDNGTTWISLGISNGTNSDGSGFYNYTLSNKRYLRMVIIEVYNQYPATSPTVLVLDSPSISNAGGTNLFTNLNQFTISNNFSIDYIWTTGTASIKLYCPYYSPTTYFSIGYYTGNIFTTVSNTKTGSAIVSVAGLTQTTSLRATSGTFSKIFMADKRSGLNGTLLSGNQGCNFYMGTMSNTDIGNYSDVLYLNSWTDSSAGNINAVMFRKSAIGMRIYQGAVGAASNFTTYQDALLFDTNSGNLTLGASSNTVGITFGPNASWSSYLKVGSGDNRVGSVTAQVITTNGDLHLTSADNVRGIYLNFYVKDAASTYLYSYTPLTHNNSLTVTGAVSSSGVTTSDWYYMNGSAGMEWSSYSNRGIASPEHTGNTYGNAATYGSGNNGWSGWGLGSVASYMGVNSEFGIHHHVASWLIYCTGTSERLTYLASSVRCGQTYNRFEVYFNGYNHSNGYYYINSGGGSWSASDERIKKNIKPIDPNISVEFMNGIIPSYFCLKEATPCTQKKIDGTEETIYPSVCSCEQSGFIAQNVLEIVKKVGLPKSIVNNWYDYEQELLLPDTERKTILGVSETPLTCHLVNALKAKMKMLKEQQEQISMLQHKLATYTITLNNVRETVRQQTELLQQLQIKT